MENPVTIYWAGDLFNFKDLAGNMQLASAVEKLSGGRYEIKLPQLSESNSKRTVKEIRDADLELLINCDMILANFDGTDLDSGTVVEFCFARMLDMPCLLLRTDFRSNGDQAGGDPWNLMCSGYPRTETLILHGMTLFHTHFGKGGTGQEILNSYYNDMAQKIIDCLDRVRREPPIYPPEILEEHYRRIIAAGGESLTALFPPKRIEQIVKSKLAKREDAARI